MKPHTELRRGGKPFRLRGRIDSPIPIPLTVRKEGIIPALESSHAFAQAFKEAAGPGTNQAILINQSGRGDKDIFTIADALDDPSWRKFIIDKAEAYRARG